MEDRNSATPGSNNPRKRGRPPRTQSKKQKKNNKEEDDVCFICFDGGSLVLCDRRSCPKAYHPACIKRDHSFFQVKAKWTCGWHICSVCLKAAHYMCYTCTYSLCKGCTSNADYLSVRGDKGFCATCMRTIMLIEKKEEGDKEMAHVDFDDKSSWEYLFKAYWLYLKEKLSLNLVELSQAKNLRKESGTMICKGQVPCFHESTNNIRSSTVDRPCGQLEFNTSIEKKCNESLKIQNEYTSRNEERPPQNNQNDYAAIDIRNINMIYLRRNLMENLIEDSKFHDKVVGSVVRIRISGGEKKHSMYRLVKVVGTTKVSLPYKVGVKATDVMLEVLNLDKKEVVSIDTISNQDFSEDECRCLRQSIKCGHIKGFIAGEIQEKALALQSVRLNNLEAETWRLNHLHDQESEKGRKKELRERVEKLQLLKTPQEHHRRLCGIPDVHIDPSMDPFYESEKEAELDSQEQVQYIKPRYSGKREGKPISPREKGDICRSTGCNIATPSGRRNISATPCPTKEQSAAETLQRLSKGRDACGLKILERPRNDNACLGLGISDLNNQAVGTLTTFSTIASKVSTPAFSVENTTCAYSGETKLWHYIDPNGKIQGPFCMVQLQKWSTNGYFLPDMRIWAGDSQENSILLTDALKGMFHKVASLPNDISSKSLEVVVTSDSELQMSDLVFTDNVSASRYCEETDVHWCGDIANIHSKSRGETLSSDGCNSQTCVWTTPVVSYIKEAPLVSCSQEQDSFKSNSCCSKQHQVQSLLSSTMFVGRENETHSGDDLYQEVKGCKSDPDYENRSSSGTTVSKSSAGQILGDHSNSQRLSVQSCGDNRKNLRAEFSSNTLNLNSVPSLNFLNVAAEQQGKLNVTDLRSPSKHKCETNEKKESASFSAHIKDLNFQDLLSPTPTTGIANQKEFTDKTQQSVTLSSPYQDSGPIWSNTSSIMVGGLHLADISNDWDGHSPAQVKRCAGEWDSSLSSLSSIKPAEGLCDHVATATSMSDELAHYFETHSAFRQSTTLQLSTELIEFSTLPEESVSDLWAEVDAMESQHVLASPTSGTNNGEEF